MGDLASLSLYIICFLASAKLLSIGIKKSNQLIKFIALSIPIFLVGLRVDIGTDYPGYVSIFQQYSDMSLPELITASNDSIIESGFLGIIYISSLFTSDAWLMFLLSSLLTIGVAYLAIQRISPKSVPLAFLLYLFVITPFITNGVRQAIAISFIFFAYSYIIRGNPIKFLLIVMLASLFHTSAFAVLPLYLLRFITVKKRTDNQLTLLLSILIASLSVLLIPLVLVTISAIPVLSSYVRYEGFQTGFPIATVLLMAVLTFVVIASYSRLARASTAIPLMAALFFIEFASLFLGNVSAAFSRMSFYFAIGGLIYMSNIPMVFTGNTRRIVEFGVIMYGISYFIIFYYFFGYSEIFPYQSIWGGSN